MTTSDNDGQALVAIRKANEILRSENQTWESFILGVQKTKTETTWNRHEKSPKIDAAFATLRNSVKKTSTFRGWVDNAFRFYCERGYLTTTQYNILMRTSASTKGKKPWEK